MTSLSRSATGRPRLAFGQSGPISVYEQVASLLLAMLILIGAVV